MAFRRAPATGQEIPPELAADADRPLRPAGAGVYGDASPVPSFTEKRGATAVGPARSDCWP
jgi:hypothetical protein